MVAGKRILVIEDEFIVAAMVCDALEDLGAELGDRQHVEQKHERAERKGDRQRAFAATLDLFRGQGARIMLFVGHRADHAVTA